ncbi:hypothetical protein [Actinoplanes sp. G11-F43]|uniref:hypothetical protein n=1 Tax=Actinoplanes sp. G11-F43 TaxID=3424130 RepID=UPI003D3331D8
MESRLLPVNGLVGLVTAGDVNRAVLAEAGFRIAGLEVPAAAHGRKVVIDVLLFNEVTNHLVLVESKSGANIEEGQARTYRDLPPAAAVQAGYVTVRSRSQPTAETLYVCLAEHAGRIRLGLKAAGVPFPVLSVAPRRIELLDGEFASKAISAALEGGVDLIGPPPRLIPFDHESPVEVVEQFVQAEMVAMLAHRREVVTVTSLTESVARHYGLYAHRAQQALRVKVASAVDRVVAAAPDRFAHDRKTGVRPEGLVRFLRTPEDLDRRGRTQAYQALGRSGRSRHTADPNQLDLLRELEVGDNDEDDPVVHGAEEER